MSEQKEPLREESEEPPEELKPVLLAATKPPLLPLPVVLK